MKKILITPLSFILFFSVALLFSSCEKETTEEINADIYGKSLIDDLSFDMTLNGGSYLEYLVSMGVPKEQAQMTVDFYSTAVQYEGFIEFREDGTYESGYAGYDSFEGTWKLSYGNKTLTTDAGTAKELKYNVVIITEPSLIIAAVKSQTMEMYLQMH